MPYQRILPAQPIEPDPTLRSRSLRLLRTDKVGPAFWTVASFSSLIINMILIVILVLLARQLFILKNLVHHKVLGGLYGNFVKMDSAHIKTTIPIQTNVPAKFDLPLKTTTIATLNEDTLIPQATIYGFRSGTLTITNATSNIVLPAGTQLPIQHKPGPRRRPDRQLVWARDEDYKLMG